MQAASRFKIEIPGYEGRVQLAKVELFWDQPVVWLRTDGGNMFVPGEDGLVFLSPDEFGQWQVGTCPKDTMRGGRWLHQGLELDMAVELASSHVRENFSDTVSSSDRAWRRKSPSPSQVSYAQSLRIDTDGMNRGELSDAISVKKASRVLDRPLARARKGK